MHKLLIKYISLVALIYSCTATADTLFLEVSGRLNNDNNQQTSNITGNLAGFKLQIGGLPADHVIRNFAEVYPTEGGVIADDKFFKTRDVSMKLVLDRESGKVKGQSSGIIIDFIDVELYFVTRLEGDFICINPGKKRCQMMTIDIHSTGVIFDGPGVDRTAVGTITEQLIGTFFTGDANEQAGFHSLDSSGIYAVNEGVHVILAPSTN
jgi:hypothetical protein